MSASHTPSEADILAEIQRTLSATPNDKPKIKVGDQEFSMDNAQAIQDAINNSLNRNQSEFETLRSQVEQLNNARVIQPELDARPPVQTVPQQVTPPRKPRTPSNEEWATDFVKDPQRVFDETLARMLGLEGSGGEALRNIVQGIGTELQASKLERQALLAKAQELDQKITRSGAETEAQRFIDKNPEYEISKENQMVMERYLTEYQLPATEKNLTLIFNQAVADGKIERVNHEQPQQNQQFTQEQVRRSGVPRLGGQSQTTQDEGYLIEQANKLPLHEHAALIERLRQGQFNR